MAVLLQTLTFTFTLGLHYNESFRRFRLINKINSRPIDGLILVDGNLAIPVSQEGGAGAKDSC